MVTEFGVMHVAPTEICVIGRGMRFAVELLQVGARSLMRSSLRCAGAREGMQYIPGQQA